MFEMPHQETGGGVAVAVVAPPRGNGLNPEDSRVNPDTERLVDDVLDGPFVNIGGGETRRSPEFRSYKRRWYILGAFSFYAMLQCLIWNTWGPISRAVQYGYGWSDSVIAMMANWGTLMFILTAWPLTWFIGKYHLRATTVLVIAFSAIGTVLRTLTIDPEWFQISSHLCAILNGISGVTVMAAPPLISANWFPPGERTTATSINMIFNQLGNGMAYFLGPLLVPDSKIISNATLENSFNDNSSSVIFNDGENGDQPSQEEVRIQIQWYMNLMAGLTAANLLAVVVYFPSFPPSPPSPTAAIERINFKEGIVAIVKSPNMWLCTMAYAFPSGVVGAWTAVMTLNFQPLGVTDSESGWIGVTSVFASCATAFAFAYITDHLRKQIKLTLILLFSAAAAFFVWLTLICLKVIPFQHWQLWTAAILGTCANFAASPLIFEYSVEMAYPVPEAVVSGFMTSVNNFFALIFLSLFFIPNLHFAWMNYVLVASAVIAVPCVGFTKESYRRSAVDAGEGSGNPEGDSRDNEAFGGHEEELVY